MRHNSIIVIAYFLLLAILVCGLKTLGINAGMQSILAAMAIAGIIMLIGWLIMRAIKRKVSRHNLSGKQWAAVMFGHAPATMGVVDADLDTAPAQQNRALVPQAYDIHPVMYAEEVEDELPDTIIEPGGLPLAETFQPSIHTLLGAMVAIFGIRSYGKSNALAVIIEALAPYDLPILICDTKDEYAGLVQPAYLRHGYMVGAPGFSANVPEEVRLSYLPVDEEHAFEFGKVLMNGHLQIVLNLKSYKNDDLAARVMCKIIEGISAWEEARPNAKRIPVEIALDEAHKWLPQQERESNVSRETQVLLQNTFFSTIVRMGRSYGFGLIVASQRISELDKRCLQSTWQFLFKQMEDIDIKRYEVKDIPREEVLSLRQGECFVFCPLALGFRVQMYAKRSPDLSQTPGLAELKQHRVTTNAYDFHRHSFASALPQADEAFLQQATAALEQLTTGMPW